MKSNYIRPLKFDYVDANEQHCKTTEIPVKFIQEKDDYQKRKTKAEATIEQPQPQQQSVEEPLNSQPFQQIHNQPIQEPAERTYKQPTNQSLFGCCQSGIQEGELCAKCGQALCQNCVNNPERIRHCTKCLQKLCGKCKKTLKIAFPDYKLRNYAINLKNYHNLHFSDCPCPKCSPSK